MTSSPVADDYAKAPHDPVALTELRAAVRAFILRRVRDAALAEDLTQETLLRMSRSFTSIRSGDRLEAWVYRVARNVMADHFRALRPTETFEESTHAPVDESGLGDPMVEAEEARLRRCLAGYVRTVVEGLPEKYRDALRLTEFEGVAQVELARRLGLSTSAAKSRVQRARVMVREEMERCCRWEFDRYGTALSVHSKKCGCDVDMCDGG